MCMCAQDSQVTYRVVRRTFPSVNIVRGYTRSFAQPVGSESSRNDPHSSWYSEVVEDGASLIMKLCCRRVSSGGPYDKIPHFVSGSVGFTDNVNGHLVSRRYARVSQVQETSTWHVQEEELKGWACRSTGEVHSKVLV